jgi:integrase
MTGHIRRRGSHSWELKFDNGRDPANGKRITRYRSFKGTKREAEAELIRLKAAADRGDYIDPSKATLGQFLDRWESWAATQVSPKTLERNQELTKLYVRPNLGATPLQKLRPVNLVELYANLQRAKAESGAGLAPRTIGHVHRLLKRVLGHAVKWGAAASNPASLADPPRVQRVEIEILDPARAKALIQGLRGRALYPIAILGLAAGLRRGELVALRWKDIDLDAGKVMVEQSLEQTRGGLRFKPPKTKAGRRTVSVPASVASELRAHWKRQQEQRVALGLGRASGEDLVFARLNGTPYPPNSLTFDWARTVRRLKLPIVTFHALRHTHVSQLIASGLDVVTVSRRIGHSNPTTTLGVYAHLFGDADQRAVNVVDASMASILQ